MDSGNPSPTDAGDHPASTPPAGREIKVSVPRPEGLESEAEIKIPMTGSLSVSFQFVDSLACVALFSELDHAARQAIAALLVPVRLGRGETLFREGEPGRDLFIVQTGEVRVMAQGGTREVCRIGPGGHFGEMALLEEAPRSATIVAACDTVLWQLRKEDFESRAAHPAIHRQIIRALAQRLRGTTQGQSPQASRTALLFDARDPSLTDDGTVGGLREAIGQATGRPVALLEIAADGAPKPSPIIAGATVIREPAVLRALADTLPRTHGPLLVVAAAGGGADPLLHVACDRVELVVVLVRADPDSLARAAALIDRLGRLAPASPPLLEIALDRRGETTRQPFDPVGQLAAGRVVHTVFPTPGYPASGAPDFGGLGRLGRRMAGRRLGLALGGGGVRALAHIGVLEVFEQAGIPVDLLAGTSGGAMVAACAALDWNSQRIGEFMLTHWTRRGLFDWGVPWTSLLRGRKVERLGQLSTGGRRIEELSRPFAAVATDLVAGEEVRLRHGDIWTAVRASISLPGIFPPVRIGQRYLVDGGAVDNLPVAACRESGADIIIGVNVTPPLDPAFQAAAADARPRHPLRRLWAQWRGGPPLPRIIYRTISAQGVALQARQRPPDLLLSPDVVGYDVFEFHGLEAIIDRGRVEAQNRLSEVRQLLCRPS